jgi:hypothetical protein
MMTDEGAALRALPKLFELWQLTDEQAAALLGVTEEIWIKLQSGDHDGLLIAADIWKRADALCRIHAALRVILMQPRCNNWVHRPHKAPMFAGETALKFMIEGGWPAIERVRRYLDAELAS